MKVAMVGIEWDVVDLIDSIPLIEVAGFFDPFSSSFSDFEYFGNDQNWNAIRSAHPDLKIILALDNPNIRARLFDHYGRDAVITLVSPLSHISKRAIVGQGSIIQRGVAIMPQVRLGFACKVNVNATIHHEAIINNCCTIAPGAQILGKVVLEEQVYVGAGAIIRQRCRVGKGAIIGAGAVVVKDIPSGATVVGVPAENLKQNPLYPIITSSKD